MSTEVVTSGWEDKEDLRITEVTGKDLYQVKTFVTWNL